MPGSHASIGITSANPLARHRQAVRTSRKQSSLADLFSTPTHLITGKNGAFLSPLLLDSITTHNASILTSFIVNT